MNKRIALKSIVLSGVLAASGLGIGCDIAGIIADINAGPTVGTAGDNSGDIEVYRNAQQVWGASAPYLPGNAGNSAYSASQASGLMVERMEQGR